MSMLGYHKVSWEVQSRQFSDLVHELLGTYLLRSVYFHGRQTDFVSKVVESPNETRVVVRNCPSREEFVRLGTPQSFYKENFFYAEIVVSKVGEQTTVAIRDFKLPVVMQRQRRFKTLIDVIRFHIERNDWSTELDVCDNSDGIVTDVIERAGLTIKPVCDLPDNLTEDN